MLGYLERFDAQLNLYSGMLDEVEVTKSDSRKRYPIESLFNLILARKYDEYHVSKNPERIETLSEEAKVSRNQLYKLTDDLIKKQEIANQIYTDLDLHEKDSTLVLNSSNKIGGIMALISQRSQGQFGTNEQSRYKTQSICVSVCSSLETLCYDLMREYYVNISENDKIDKSIHYEKVKEFDSINDIKRYLVDEQVTSIFRGSFDTWKDKILSTYNVTNTFKDIEDTTVHINEFFQRRNLFVHTGGKVSWYYIRNTAEDLCKGIKDDEVIVTKKEYVKNNIQLIRELGYMIFFCYLQRAYNDQPDELSDEINAFFLSRIMQKNDAIPKILWEISKWKKNDSFIKMISWFNYCLYHKIHDSFEVVENDLKNFDTETLDVQFKMAKAILLENDDALILTKKFFNDLDEGNFLLSHDWPLIGLVRDKPEFKEYFQENLNKILGIKKKRIKKKKEGDNNMNLVKEVSEEYKENVVIPVEDVDVVVDYSDEPDKN